MFKIKNDMSQTMRDALKAAWQYEAANQDKSFMPHHCNASDKTMTSLCSRGFVDYAEGIRYKLTERGRQYCAFQFGGTLPSTKTG